MGRVTVPSLLVVCLVLIARGIIADYQGDALDAFKKGLFDPNGILNSWDNTLVTPCSWFHISCNDDNEVVRVDVGNAALGGQIHPDLGKLKKLQYLELYSSGFYGPIPEALGNLTNLVSLDLYDNAITGEIPSVLGSLPNLIFVRLDRNNLEGPVPEWDGVKVVNVSDNLDLCGPHTDKECRN